MKDSVIINQTSLNLENILQDCWHWLKDGADSAMHPFHCPSISTMNGISPEIRTVVLRKVIAEEKTLIFHTDYRSPKIDQIYKNNNISWLFYDAKSRIQLRIKTLATIHHKDEITLKRWNDSRLESKKCYLVPQAPSSLASYPGDGLPEHIERKDLNEVSLKMGYDNFAVVKNIVSQIDWLFLKHDGHRRAQFILGEHEVEKFWLIP